MKIKWWDKGQFGEREDAAIVIHDGQVRLIFPKEEVFSVYQEWYDLPYWQLLRAMLAALPAQLRRLL